MPEANPVVELIGRGWFDGIALLGSIVSILAILLTAYTAMKIRSVSRAQREERKMLRELFAIDDLRLDLLRAAGLLKKDSGVQASEMATKLTAAAGNLEGISRALDHVDGDRDDGGARRSQVGALRFGYCSSAFYCEVAESASETLDILVYRNLQVATVDVIEELQRTCAREVRIRLLALHSAAAALILESAAQNVPRPLAGDAAGLATQLLEGEKKIKEIVEREWQPSEAALFEYRAYQTMACGHCFIADGTVHTGFLHTRTLSQQEHADQRPYLTFEPSSSVAVQMQAHFDNVWDETEETTIAGGSSRVS